MNEEFFNSKEFYLVDTFNGIVKKSRIKFEVINNSKYKLVNTKEIAIESKTRKVDNETGEEYYAPSMYEAFMKSSVDKTRDDLDIINSEIADLLDIAASKVYRIETDTNMCGVVNISVKDQSEQQIGLDMLVNKVIKLIKERTIDLNPWLKSYFSLPIGDKTYVVNSEADVISTIEMGIRSISLLFKLNDEQLENLKTDYIKMILFDFISNNSLRGFNTYSIIVNKDLSFKKLAPVYDYNNELTTSNVYLLNNVYIDKSALISTLFSKYYEYIKKITKGLRDNSGLYLESMNLIIKNNIDEVNALTIMHNYKTNVEVIKSLENSHSKEMTENRLDLAMTQTSINLNALNKNQMVHSKYRIIKKEEVNKVEKQEDIKIKVEEEKKESNTFFNIVMVILAIIFTMGIIAGVVYLVLNLR
ncbi:MAG: hypothetical protein E7159_03475 [Firmicutes bacterium]|nr:hypothetical protein [Bacillota bacterium]